MAEQSALVPFAQPEDGDGWRRRRAGRQKRASMHVAEALKIRYRRRVGKKVYICRQIIVHMKHIKTLAIMAVVMLTGTPLRAQTAQDSVDVLDYDISVDLSADAPFAGDATLTVRLTAPCSTLELSLRGEADTVWVNGTALDSPTLAAIPTATHAAGDTLTVRVRYHGAGFVESYGWGGFHFDSDMSYNLGVGFSTSPHVLGDALMPCRNNFHDKATYTLRVRTKAGWTAECGGELQGRSLEADGTERSVWRIAQPVSTYLVSVSQSAWKRIYSTVPSLHGTYPLTLGYLQGDSAHVARAFAELDSVVPMFERCLGPYRWGRIGYIATAQGSMEHVNNIALAKDFMASTSERAQMTIAHELGHAWFGNLATCRTAEDMWFNEGGASFCSELAMEANAGREAATRYYQTNLESVLRQTHITDGAYRPLSPMPQQYTYGSTTYDKGALVWHSLRGLLGDSLFYRSMRQLFADKAFGTVDATEVRDSLAAYSGVDLGDFFDFHVYSPGFADYHVELASHEQPSVRIRRQGVGTTAMPQGDRVPVTFFGTDGSTMKAWFNMSGDEGGGTLDVTYPVAYCVLDYDCELSDAATVAELRKGGPHSIGFAHFKYVGTLPEEGAVTVEHHWGRPWEADTLAGVTRTAGRYWMVRGPQAVYEGVQGQFRYVRDGYTDGSYTHLDHGFLGTASAVDSLVLLYRSGSDQPWQAVSHRRTGNSNEGYLTTDNLRTGEYTLAVADTTLLGIADIHAAPSAFHLFPNPVAQGGTLTLKAPVEGCYTVRIFDAAGHQVWQRKCCHNGRKISPRLASGTYLVQIENKFVSLQSKLIVL